jgi:hypothetical protein
MILIGSNAALQHDKSWSSPSDIDVIATFEELTRFLEELDLKAIPISKDKYLTNWLGKHTEIEIAWPGSSGADLIDILDRPDQDTKEIVFNGVDMTLPSMDWLFTLKASHRYLKNSPHFLKTMSDYFYMKNDLRCKISDKEWFKKREKETYTKPRPKLNQSKKDFFKGDGIVYKYDHDTIHESVMHLEKPAYMYYKIDDEEVLCSKDKWDSVSDEIKKYGVLEESYVLALERSQIPFENEISPRQSFFIALKKVCTSITSGWFREYAYENYPEIAAMYNSNYVTKFKNGVENGTVKPFQNL